MKIVRGRWLWTSAAVLVIVGASITALHAQRIWSGFYGRTPPRFPTSQTFEGSFHFCRVMFSSDRREKQGWSTDYPGADLNFSTRLAELTKVRVKMTHDGDEEVPDAVVVRLTDDALFKCPFTLMEDAGTARFSEEEVARLRQYLLKGGFLLVSDYHGDLGQEQFDEEIAPRPAARRFSHHRSRAAGSSALAHDVPGGASSAAGLDQHLAPHRRRHD